MWPFNRKTSLHIHTVTREPVKLRLHEWQADQQLSNAAAKVLLEPTFQLMLQVNKNESPALMSLSVDCSLESRALHQARIEGFNMALRNFEAMAMHRPLPLELTATFEDEEKDL